MTRPTGYWGTSARVEPHACEEPINEGTSLERDCEFDGDVEVEVGDGLKTWTCPECGHEHVEDWSPSDDWQD